MTKPKKAKGKRGVVVPVNGAELAGVYKEKDFNRFVMWLSLPDLFKGRGAAYLAQIGVEDEEARELLELKTMSAFAEKYKLENSTLTGWKKKAKELGLLTHTKDFFKEMTKNVYGAFYFQTLKYADAQRVRLWEEIFHDKAPEGVSPLVNNNILTPQFNQVIIQMKGEYKEKLRKYYEQQIKQSRKV